MSQRCCSNGSLFLKTLNAPGDNVDGQTEISPRWQKCLRQRIPVACNLQQVRSLGSGRPKVSLSARETARYRLAPPIRWSTRRVSRSHTYQFMNLIALSALSPVHQESILHFRRMAAPSDGISEKVTADRVKRQSLQSSLSAHCRHRALKIQNLPRITSGALAKSASGLPALLTLSPDQPSCL